VRKIQGTPAYVGEKHNRFTCIEINVGFTKFNRTLHLFKCNCGNLRIASISNVRSGNYKSCGCLKIDKTVERSYKHGYSNTRTYRIWTGMRQRCFNLKDTGYADYGKRGITICERWNDFTNFFEDMGLCPPGLSIERIDNNSGYSPENCKWAAKDEQMGNRRNSITLQLFGISGSIKQWAAALDIKTGIIVDRLRYGWSVEDTLCTPIISKPRKK